MQIMSIQTLYAEKMEQHWKKPLCCILKDKPTKMQILPDKINGLRQSIGSNTDL